MLPSTTLHDISFCFSPFTSLGYCPQRVTIQSKNRYILNFNSYCQITFQKGCSDPHSLLQSVWLHRDCCRGESCLPAWVTPGYQNSEEAQMGFPSLISFHEGMTPWHPYLKKWLPWQLPLWGLLWLGKHVCMNYGSSSCFFPSLLSQTRGFLFLSTSSLTEHLMDILITLAPALPTIPKAMFIDDKATSLWSNFIVLFWHTVVHPLPFWGHAQ